MGIPVHRYKGYEILCSLTGYTVMHAGVEVLNVGTADADPEAADCAEVDHLLPHAQRAIDRLIDDEGKSSGGAG